MRTFFIKCFEDHGLWSLDGVNCSVAGYTTFEQALKEWQTKADYMEFDKLIERYDKQKEAGERK